MKIYVSFGQGHTHRVNNVTLDKNCIAVITCETRKEGRDIAFSLFGDKFFTDYTEDKIKEIIHFFPRGYIYVN